MNIEELMTRKESLVPELEMSVQPWQRKPDRIGLFHPLVHEPFYFSEMNAIYNEQLRRKREAIEKAKQEKNWILYIFMHERPYRLQAFNDIVEDMSDGWYWKALEGIWTDSENIWQFQSEWLHFLTDDTHGDPALFMSKDERDYLKRLPDKFVIYRGCQEQNKEGCSWTLNPEKAKWFAKRYSQNGRVRRRTVKREDCFAYLSGRNEDEIIYLKEVVS